MLDFLYHPFFNALIYLYDLFNQNIGLAIIVFTVAIKLVLAWPTQSMVRAQRKMQLLQPKLAELKARYKNDREGLAKATMEMYKKNKANPLSSCLPALIQLPILFALYQVFFNGLKTDPGTGLLAADQLNILVPSLREIYNHSPIHTSFLGIDLAKHGVIAGNIILGLLAGGLQFIQSKMLMSRQPPNVPGAKDESLAAVTSKQMTYLFPIVTVIIALQLPAGLALYWTVSTLVTIVQQWLVIRKMAQEEEAAHAAPSA